jgi:hypothetical protein
MGEKGSTGRTKGTIRKPMVEPEGCRGAIIDVNIGNRPKCVKFISNNFPKVAVRPVGRSIKGGSITNKPVLPSSRFIGEEFIDELHEQATVL